MTDPHFTAPRREERGETMSETRKETAEMRAWKCLDCGMEGEATDIPTAQEHHTSIHGCRGLCGWMPSSPQRAAARRETPRLRWRTMDNGWATTTAEGWEYRIRYVQCGFSTDAQQSDGSWICIAPIRATLQQAKFCAFSDARWRRTEMEAPNAR